MSDDPTKWTLHLPGGRQIVVCPKCGALVYAETADLHIDWHIESAVAMHRHDEGEE